MLRTILEMVNCLEVYLFYSCENIPSIIFPSPGGALYFEHCFVISLSPSSSGVSFKRSSGTLLLHKHIILTGIAPSIFSFFWPLNYTQQEWKLSNVGGVYRQC